MKIVLFEIGLNKQDTQHQMIEFEGSLKDYLEKTKKEIEENQDLDLFNASEIDDSTIFIEYFSKAMKKMIRSYAFLPKEPINF